MIKYEFQRKQGYRGICEELGFKQIILRGGTRGQTGACGGEPSCLQHTGHFTLYVQEGEPHPPVASFTVHDINEARKRLVEAGCTIIADKNTSLYFRDPDGVLWDIIEGYLFFLLSIEYLTASSSLIPLSCLERSSVVTMPTILSSLSTTTSRLIP
jgi:hypothetical protein